MIAAKISDMAGLVGGEVRGADAAFRGVTIDSRQLKREQLFVALSGERVDGHDFVASAAANGAAAALVERWVDSDLTQLRCESGVRALGQMAGDWRARHQLPVVGITGSNGKTTVKTMLAQIAGQRHEVLVSQGNFNNELGLPLTVCELGDEHDMAIFEMGAARPGDIAYLGAIGKPDVGVITNAGPAHLDGMGDVAGVARTKGELIDALPDAGRGGDQRR